MPDSREPSEQASLPGSFFIDGASRLGDDEAALIELATSPPKGTVPFPSPPARRTTRASARGVKSTDPLMLPPLTMRNPRPGTAGPIQLPGLPVLDPPSRGAKGGRGRGGGRVTAPPRAMAAVEPAPPKTEAPPPPPKEKTPVPSPAPSVGERSPSVRSKQSSLASSGPSPSVRSKKPSSVSSVASSKQPSLASSVSSPSVRSKKPSSVASSVPRAAPSTAPPSPPPPPAHLPSPVRAFLPPTEKALRTLPAYQAPMVFDTPVRTKPVRAKKPSTVTSVAPAPSPRPPVSSLTSPFRAAATVAPRSPRVHVLSPRPLSPLPPLANPKPVVFRQRGTAPPAVGGGGSGGGGTIPSALSRLLKGPTTHVMAGAPAAPPVPAVSLAQGPVPYSSGPLPPLPTGAGGYSHMGKLAATPDFAHMDAGMQEWYRSRLLFQLNKLAEERPSYGIDVRVLPGYSLEQLHGKLSGFTDGLKVSSKVVNYKFYYMMAAVFIQLFFNYVLGLNASGFAYAQFRIIRSNRYDSLLREIGEKHSIESFGTGSPEIRLAMAMGLNLLIFVGLHLFGEFLARRMGGRAVVVGLVEKLHTQFLDLVAPVEEEGQGGGGGGEPPGVPTLPRNELADSQAFATRVLNQVDTAAQTVGLAGGLFGWGKKGAPVDGGGGTKAPVPPPPAPTAATAPKAPRVVPTFSKPTFVDA